MSLSEAQQQPIKQEETTEIVSDEQVAGDQPIKKKRSKKIINSEQALQQQPQGFVQQQQQELVQQQQQGLVQQQDNNRSKAPRLRLDLNLDAEIHLKAKVHGDITLTLLS